MKWEEAFTAVQQELLQLFVRKNTDYGDAFEVHGPVGCVIRIGDKLARLQTIDRNRVEIVQDESMQDTLLDLANYCTIALMMLRDGHGARAKKNIDN